MADTSSMEALTMLPEAAGRLEGFETNARLLGLPRELRDLILGHILVKDTATITMLSNASCYKDEISACPPSICSVNHQLRAEALPTFYSANLFSAQLDNITDLTTAKAWLSVIGDYNARRLRRISMGGWTRVPFGHMVSRRWLQIIFNLRDGSMVIAGRDGLGAAQESACQHPEVTTSIEELQAAFKRVYDTRDGEPFDTACLERLMDGFHMLCTGY